MKRQSDRSASSLSRFSRKSIAIFSGAALALIIAAASLPMRLMLDSSGAASAGLAARSVTGSIWDGELRDAQIGLLPLGDIAASLSPASLLSGDIAMNFRRKDSALGPLEGRIFGGGARGFADVNGQLPLSLRMGPIALGRMQLNGAGLRFDRQGLCRDAGGTVQIHFSAPVAGMALDHGLMGPINCAGKQAQIALASQSGMEKLNLSVVANGAWRAKFSVASVDDPVMQAGLMAMGFQAAGDGYALVVTGEK